MAKRKSVKLKKQTSYLGDFVLSPYKFKNLDKVFKEFRAKEFLRLNEMQKTERINRLLLDLIQSAPIPGFLLPAVTDYIEQIAQMKVLEIYTFSHFELWLNQFSGLADEDNYRVRAHIAGKYIPRDEYQIYFPVGMGKVHPGSHFVTAHSSPDLDTTVASFWGWVDAFAARVGEKLHVWNLPGGVPPPQIEVDLLFNQIFGEGLFTHLAKARTSLAISSLDLLSQKGLVKKQMDESTLNIEHERSQNAVVLVDELGFYIGDWRTIDVEGVRHVLLLLNQTLRWFENNLHVKMISLFAKENLSSKDFPAFVSSIFGIRIRDAEPVQEFTERQKQQLADYLTRVLLVKEGLDSTFEEFARAMKALSLSDFQDFINLFESLKKSNLFDRSGYLVENRPRIFNHLEKIIKGLTQAIQSVRNYVERLDVALKIKIEVFGYFPQMLSYRADLEEIRSKMGSYSSLTVTTSDKEGRAIPLGVVHARDLLKPILGTVTLRDFCNREETKIPSYLEVISVIDHHKSSLLTHSPLVAQLSDSQSSNALVAQLAFKINDAHGVGGMTRAAMEAERKEVAKDLRAPENKRLMQRLLQKQLACEKTGDYFVDPTREALEYMHFLYAILDDTDLLTKVSFKDVHCVASLLNRLKSLMLKKEVEVISFDDLPQGSDFVTLAAKRILQNVDMYSLYRKIYKAKEQAVEKNIQLCLKGRPSSIFVDTKEQNGCCRVGQTKMFAKNIPSFLKHAVKLRKAWCEDAHLMHKEKGEIDLHMHMISTIAGAEDLFAGTAGKYKHPDELWIWIPSVEQAVEHLKSFLNAFRHLPQIVGNRCSVEFFGENAKELDLIFKESFLPIPRTTVSKTGLPIAVLKYNAGSINSRKAQVSPCLPQLTS